MSAANFLTQTVANAIAVVLLQSLQAWLPTNLNEGHYDWFMFVMAGMMLFATMYCQWATYTYKKTGGSYQIHVLREGGSLFADGSVDNSTRQSHQQQLKEAGEML